LTSYVPAGAGLHPAETAPRRIAERLHFAVWR
jgi:hypothetical protein